MINCRRIVSNRSSITKIPWSFVASAALMLLAYLQLFVGQKWHQGSYQDAKQSDELVRVLTALAARGAEAPIGTALDIICGDVHSWAYPSNPLLKAFFLARRNGLVLPCHLPELQSFNLSICAGKCVIAANLHNSESVLPNMIVQLIRVAQLLGPANVFVSIYESESTDSTPEWLQLLGGVLHAMSVRFVVTAGGNLTRTTGQDRIAFLSSVRQAAVDQVLGACDGIALEFCNASRVVFVNDVFFYAEGLIRLLQYDAEDVACGMDFEPILADHIPLEQHSFMAQHLQQVWCAPPALAVALASWSTTFKLWRRRYRRDDSLLGILPLSFYDIWVARDMGGGRFYRVPPYTRHNPTSERLQAGLPVSAYCCWNGLVALQGHPLLSRRVAFRAHSEGECYASECSLLCADLYSQGPARVVIDPSVRVSYRAVAAQRMYDNMRGDDITETMDSSPPGGHIAGTLSLPYLPWNHTMLAELEVWRQKQGLPVTVECCSLLPGRDTVDFEKGCVRETVSRLTLRNLK